MDDAVEYTMQRLEAADVAADTAESVVVAVKEAIGNVVRHAASAAHSFELIVGVRRGYVVIEVVDFGPGFRLSTCEMPDALAESGRGLPLMRRLCDSVAYHRSDAGNRLVLKKRIAGAK
jgi:serine/threonine-protein kinase RsbW